MQRVGCSRCLCSVLKIWQLLSLHQNLCCTVNRYLACCLVGLYNPIMLLLRTAASIHRWGPFGSRNPLAALLQHAVSS
jgi:hypothetical protein